MDSVNIILNLKNEFCAAQGCTCLFGGPKMLLVHFIIRQVLITVSRGVVWPHSLQYCCDMHARTRSVVDALLALLTQRCQTPPPYGDKIQEKILTKLRFG